MKKILFSAFLALSAYIAPSQAQTKIAVMPFDVLSKEPYMEQFGLGTSDTLTNALGSIPDFIMVDRGQMSVIMKEQALQQSGFTDSSNSIKLGKLLNVDLLIIGSIQNEDKVYRITARFTDVQTGKILKSLQVTGNSIFNLQDQLAQDIIKEKKITIDDSQKKYIENITNATNNNSAFEHYTKGRTAYFKFTESGYKEAIENFDKAIEADNKYTLALSSKSESQALLAYEYKKNGLEFVDLLKKAEQNALEAIKQNSELAESHRALSIVYNIQKKRKEARDEAEKAIKINPNDAESNVLLWINNKLDPDSPLIHKAISLNPYLVPALNYLGNSYALKRKFSEAMTNYKRAIEINPNYSSSYVNLANLYEDQKMPDEAINNYKKAIEINPNHVFAYYYLASIYFKQKDLDQSTNYLNNLLKINPKFLPAIAKLANIYNIQGRFREAEFILKDGLTIDPKNMDIITELGFSYQKIGDRYYFEKSFKEAVEAYSQSIKLTPKNISSLLNLGIAYYSLSDFENAINTYNQALVLAPDNSELHDNLGMTYQAQGKNSEAIIEYKKACTLGRSQTCEWLKDNKVN